MSGGGALWRVALGVECLVLLAPAVMLLLPAGVLTLGALWPFPSATELTMADRMWLLASFGVPFVLGSAAVAEVARVALATLRGRSVALGRRTLVSAWAGLAGMGAATLSFSAMGQWRAGLEPAATVAAVAAPVVLLAVQLRWQQRRMARA